MNYLGISLGSSYKAKVVWSPIIEKGGGGYLGGRNFYLLNYQFVRALQDLKSKFVGCLLDILYFYTTRGEGFDCMRLRLNANSKFDVHSFY